MAECAPPLHPAGRLKRLRWFRFLVAAGSTVISIGLAEILCRALIPPQASIRFEQDVDELQGLKLEEAAGMIEDDPELFWKLAPSTKLPEHLWPFFGVVSNGHSLREDHEIPFEKPAGEIRVLFLGDSCTYGYGVSHDAAYVEIAESVMEERLQLPVECINAGVPGYSLFQGARFLSTQGLRYDPDLVVLNFGWNDAGQWDHLGDKEHHAIMQAMRPPAALADSRMAQLLWAHWHKPTSSNSPTDQRPRLLPEEFTQEMEGLRSLLEKHQIPMLVLVWPMKFNSDPSTPLTVKTAYQIAMTEFASDLRIQDEPAVLALLDLVPLGRELTLKHGMEAIYYDDGHVTPLAHEAIGNAIVEHLMPWLER